MCRGPRNAAADRKVVICVSMLSRAADRLLGALVPTVTARAEACWFEHCYCRERSGFRRQCCVYSGSTYCGSCTAYKVC